MGHFYFFVEISRTSHTSVIRSILKVQASVDYEPTIIWLSVGHAVDKLADPFG